VGGLINFFWLLLFLAVGFPVAMGIELYMKAANSHRRPRRALRADEFMPVPEDSGIARRTREPAFAALPEQE
jgi:hypothetical protein